VRNFAQSVLIGSAMSLAMAHGIDAVAQNLVPNPNFDSGLDGWTNMQADTGAIWTLDSTDGSPTAPSGHLQAGGRPSSLVNSACIAIDTTHNIDLNVDIKSSDAMYPGHVAVYTYGDPACSIAGDAFVASSCAALPADGWQRCSQINYALPAGTQGVIISLSVYYLTSANFDDVRFGPTGTVPVTLQSFDID